ncbi:MAG: phospho-N-acetylmuramoyl-pentapeptide-transferase [Bdellovibrionales bacterium]
MLYTLLAQYADQFILFNLFRYITFRAGAAALTALIICFVIGPAVIRWLKSKQAEGQPIRADGPETHAKKKGTPTMGGLMIIISLLVSTLLWVDLHHYFTWIVLAVTLGFGAIGYWDDYLKLTHRNTKGVPGRVRLTLQLLIAAGVGALIYMTSTNLEQTTGLSIPFVKGVLIPLGIFFIPFAAIVMTGAANAVNLTDGLDGLVSVPIILAAGCYGLIAYLAGNAIFANYLGINFVPGTGELAVFCGALVGAVLGFLWFNTPPAQVFMGDTGSLALGGAIGTVAVLSKHELVLVIIGGVFVAEAVSVMVQVAYFKATGGKRFFLMAPIHHHFEKKGWSEPTVVIRFWIVAVILAMIGLSTLKLR